MNQIPDALYSDQETTTWVIVGASRGIGLEFVRQLLARGEKIIATVRQPYAEHASALWGHSGNDHGRCQMFVCDILSEASIVNFVNQLAAIPNLKIDYVVINAGVLRYPNRATELSFDEFAFHLHTNTIGPIITAQKLLQTNIPLGTIVFMSSDSGSAIDFREMEDGYCRQRWLTLERLSADPLQVCCLRGLEVRLEPDAPPHGRRTETQRRRHDYSRNPSRRSGHGHVQHRAALAHQWSNQRRGVCRGNDRCYTEQRHSAQRHLLDVGEHASPLVEGMRMPRGDWPATPGFPCLLFGSAATSGCTAVERGVFARAYSCCLAQNQYILKARVGAKYTERSKPGGGGR